MAITNGYCTLAEFKAFLIPPGQTFSTDTADDAVLEMIVEGASRFIDGECARHFYKDSTDATRYYTANDSEHVRVDDLVSVTTLAIDEGLRTYPTTWETTDFDLWPYNAAADGRPYVQIIRAVNGNEWFMTYPMGVKITGKFGWPSVPTQIKEACLVIASAAKSRRYGENLSSVTTITAGGVTIAPQDVPAIAWQKINPFRKRI